MDFHISGVLICMMANTGFMPCKFSLPDSFGHPEILMPSVYAAKEAIAASATYGLGMSIFYAKTFGYLFMTLWQIRS